MPLAFYAMAKSFLERVDPRLPVLSTILFSVSSGFGWIYLTQIKLNGVTQSIQGLFSLVNDYTYNSAMYLAQPFLYYVPLSISFTIFIFQFLLIGKLKLSKKSFITLFALLTIASFLTHVTEAVIFSLFLVFYALFSRSKIMRLKDALLASLIGFGIIDCFYVTLQYLFGETLGFSLAIPLAITALLTITFFYKKIKTQDRVISFLSTIKVKLSVKLLLYITTFIYIIGLVTWISGIPTFHTSAIIEVGSLPWFIYPILLGVGGILMFVSLFYLLEEYERMRSVMPFVALAIFALLFGWVLTFINVNLFNTGYWAKRFTLYLFFSSVVIAPLAIIKMVDSIKRSQGKIKSILVTATIISIILVFCSQSFVATVEY